MDKKPGKTTKYLIILWSLYTLPLVLFILIMVLIGHGKMGFMPDFARLENPQTNLASELITEDGELLGKYFIENRSFVEYEELAPHLVDALVATEDVRYYRHSGIDVRSLTRVAVLTVLLGRDEGGGSTISQQLAKNLFPRDTAVIKTKVGRTARLTVNKFKEWNTGVRLERAYTKNEILTMYLNTVPFGGESIMGIKSAARTFFNTTPDSLTIEQAATLVGMLKAATAYNPRINPDRSMIRRNTVINQMVKYGYLDEEVADSVKQLPIVVDYNLASHLTGPAPHFRIFLADFMDQEEPVAPGPGAGVLTLERYRRDSLRWANDPLYGWIHKNFKPDGTQYDLYRDGLKIYTTINFKMQEYAEEAVEAHLKNYLQPEFFKEKKGRPNAPFEDITREEINRGYHSVAHRFHPVHEAHSQGRVPGHGSVQRTGEGFCRGAQLPLFSVRTCLPGAQAGRFHHEALSVSSGHAGKLLTLRYDPAGSHHLPEHYRQQGHHLYTHRPGTESLCRENGFTEVGAGQFAQLGNCLVIQELQSAKRHHPDA
jgi:penicillin-binding protein 1A